MTFLEYRGTREEVSVRKPSTIELNGASVFWFQKSYGEKEILDQFCLFQSGVRSIFLNSFETSCRDVYSN